MAKWREVQNRSNEELGPIRMLCQMERLLTIKTVIEIIGQRNGDACELARRVDAVLETAHAKLIAQYDAEIARARGNGMLTEEAWEQFWNAYCEGDVHQRRVAAAQNEKKQRGKP